MIVEACIVSSGDASINPCRESRLETRSERGRESSAHRGRCRQRQTTTRQARESASRVVRLATNDARRPRTMFMRSLALRPDIAIGYRILGNQKVGLPFRVLILHLSYRNHLCNNSTIWGEQYEKYFKRRLKTNELYCTRDYIVHNICI